MMLNIKNVKNEIKDTLDIYLYDNVKGDSKDWMTGEKIISETSASYFQNLLEENKNVKNINIYINSLGGSVYEGMGIYTNLKRHKAYKTVYIDGFACSIASVIAMAGDKIIMPKNTLMMVHNVWTYAIGNATELRKIANDLDKMNTLAVESYLAKSGDKLTEDNIRDFMDAETYLTAAECIEYGLADEFNENDADMTSAKEMLNKTKEMLNHAKEIYNKAKELELSAYVSQLEKICALAKPINQETKTEDKKDNYKLFEKYFFGKGE